MQQLKLFVTGIGTDVGKTFVSAALVEALAADYWKPVQTGLSEGIDSDRIRMLSRRVATIHPETYALREPLSPHAAAELEGVEIDYTSIREPKTENHLIIEGAGGLFVPLTYSVLLADLIQRLHLPVVVVSRIYLGSINHTLLTIEALKHRNIPIFGIVAVGNENLQTERVIRQLSGVERMIRLPEYQEVAPNTVIEAASILREWIRT